MHLLIIAGQRFQNRNGKLFTITHVFWSKGKRSSIRYMSPKGPKDRTISEFNKALDSGAIEMVYE